MIAQVRACFGVRFTEARFILLKEKIEVFSRDTILAHVPPNLVPKVLDAIDVIAFVGKQ